MRNSTHPNKFELISSIRSDDTSCADHISRCELCRTVYQLLKWTGADKGPLVWEPSEELVNRSKAIARIAQSRKPARTVVGRVIFDSWGNKPALSVRQAPVGLERRLRFEAADFIIEIVGARQDSGWDFVARVYKDGKATRQFVMQIGSKKLHLSEGDCFFWESKREPRGFKLLSESLAIELGALQW